MVVEAADLSHSVEVSSQDLVPVNRIAHFNINIKDAREGDLKITLLCKYPFKQTKISKHLLMINSSAEIVFVSV